MSKTISQRGCWCAVFALVLLSWLLPAPNAHATFAGPGVIRLTWQEESLDSLLELISDLTGQRFIVDARVQVYLTLSSFEITSESALPSLRSLLQERGLAALPAGGDIRIVPADGGRESSPNQAASRVIASGIPLPHARVGNSNEYLPSSAVPALDPRAEISLEAVNARGEQRGYRIDPRNDGNEFARLGFVPGDIVLSINGTELTDARRGEQLFYEGVLANDAYVTLERAGVTEKLLLGRRRSNLLIYK